MTFVILLLLLAGLALLFSGIENQALVPYLQSWLGGGSSAAK